MIVSKLIQIFKRFWSFFLYSNMYACLFVLLQYRYCTCMHMCIWLHDYILIWTYYYMIRVCVHVRSAAKSCWVKNQLILITLDEQGVNHTVCYEIRVYWYIDTHNKYTHSQHTHTQTHSFNLRNLILNTLFIITIFFVPAIVHVNDMIRGGYFFFSISFDTLGVSPEGNSTELLNNNMYLYSIFYIDCL